ncbi:hypothetical protein [Erythrobacter sp. Alg231-14]|uniref:hypothetical protein n=1 Tax=Erythrobacter sp. Alg231-14 TaxID=1922225 RepID=UPI000D54BB40
MNVRFAPAIVALAVSMVTLSSCQEYQRDRVEDAVEEAVDASASDEDIVSATPTSKPKFGVEARPVRIGHDGPDFDACGSYGTITGLNPDGDNFLSVRSAPSIDAEELDRLTTGTGVSMCDSANGWIGIVYEGSGTAGTDCGVGSPVSNERDYDGACRSGWISERFVELVAG